MKIKQVLKLTPIILGGAVLITTPLLTVSCSQNTAPEIIKYDFPNHPRAGFWYGYDRSSDTKVLNFFNYIYDNLPLKKIYTELGLEWPDITKIEIKDYVVSSLGNVNDRVVNFDFRSVNQLVETSDEFLRENLEISEGCEIPVEITFDTNKTTTINLISHAFSYTREWDLSTAVWLEDQKLRSEEDISSSKNLGQAFERPSIEYPRTNYWAKDEWIFYNEVVSGQYIVKHYEPLGYLFKGGYINANMEYKKMATNQPNFSIKGIALFNPVNIWYMIMLGETKYWDEFLGILNTDISDLISYLPYNLDELINP